jgi:pyruvate/2-oxoglutarate dehydrogenase complex dihydrolipoamide acyltransferase (E2) component
VILVPDVIHIAIAVAAPDGLVAPVVRDAARLSLATLAAESRRLV